MEIQGVETHDFHVADGEEIEILLKGNVTTGYNWILENATDLKDVIPLNISEHNTGEYSSENSQGLMGAPGVSKFKFRINSSTTTETPKLVYKRPWETKEPHATLFLKINKK